MNFRMQSQLQLSKETSIDSCPDLIDRKLDTEIEIVTQSGWFQLANALLAVLAGPLLATFLLGFFTSASNRVVSNVKVFN